MRTGLLITAAILSLAACGKDASEPAPKLAFTPNISQAALEAHLRFLASDTLEGRMTGTRGYEVAAAYVESQFRQLGLRGMDGDEFRQAVPYARAQLLTRQAKASIIGPQGERELAFQSEFVTSADPVRESVSLSAPAVFLGYGVHAPELGHDDYAGLDLKGKIVVAYSGAPPTFGANERAFFSTGESKRDAAVKHGAIGWVSLRAAHQVKRYPWDSWAQNAGVHPTMAWLKADGTAADFDPQLQGSISISESLAPLLFEGAKQDYKSLAKLQAAGEPLPRFALPVRVSTSKRSQIDRISSPNVIGMLPGSDPALADQWVVYTAHLDHIGIGTEVDGDEIYNGAYDNAMGVALMIETARALVAAQPRRSVMFVAVGGEERGLLGSDYFAQQPPVPVEQMVANVNLDMPLFLYPLAEVIAFGSEHSSLEQVVRSAAAAEGLELAADPLPEEVLFIRSDQYSLVKQGVPAIFLVSGFKSSDPEIAGGELFGEFLNTHYHKPSDDLSRPVHWPSALKFARTNVQIGLQAANADQAPRWNEGNFFGERFAAGR